MSVFLVVFVVDVVVGGDGGGRRSLLSSYTKVKCCIEADLDEQMPLCSRACCAART